MGCLFSKEDKQKSRAAKYEVQDSAPNSPVKAPPPSKDAAASKPAAAAVKAAAPPPAKPKLDPKDFIFLKRKGEKLVKAPGTINGQQFVIDSCEDCEIYVLDMCDSLMIDDCKNCKIVVGPTTGSIFIRDCEDCKCVFMCRQYRSRDCKNIDTHLHVTTRPIIETSSNMRFGCWDFHYEAATDPALPIPSADAHMAMEVLQMAETAKVLLVRTNICSLNEAWLKPFMEAGGVEVSADAVKALATGKTVGLEFGGAGCAEALRGVASSGGFPLLDNPDQYAEWRYMGVEG